ncbi:hypothetical protein GGQ68_002680 [Sagittula marina]|uniref:Uncharacterized protein n=1 Tax=Sagittula marina TaxID=943940 RepID=A0A7W6GSD6_9RHOB|nr:hypothetical protein [Sagittula marina]MBB3986341.1 hypothetical protein [Sagittula marina]
MSESAQINGQSDAHRHLIETEGRSGDAAGRGAKAEPHLGETQGRLTSLTAQEKRNAGRAEAGVQTPPAQFGGDSYSAVVQTVFASVDPGVGFAGANSANSAHPETGDLSDDKTVAIAGFGAEFPASEETNPDPAKDPAATGYAASALVVSATIAPSEIRD